MSQVSNLVKSLLLGDSSVSKEVGQTFFLSVESRFRLTLLAELLRGSKTRVGSQLLAAALVDAIDALPDNLVVPAKFPALGEDGFYSPEEWLRLSVQEVIEIEQMDREELISNPDASVPYDPDAKLSLEEVVSNLPAVVEFDAGAKKGK
jgi:hypothetical protein